MNFTKLLLPLFIFFIFKGFSQKEHKENLQEVIITSSRIEVPFSKISKKITIISTKDIAQTTASNLTDLLQNIEGIDVVKRGVNGMQADIKLRGGNFQQTLILIDGFKVEDPQTGHHTMNMMIPLENIERIEIIKGAAARIFGQNAFTGAINIVTKKTIRNQLSLKAVYGSYAYQKGSVVASKKFEKGTVFAHFSQQKSEGYRENTDFINTNYFIKSSIHTKNKPINLIATYSEREFGAQYFYTSPASNFNEYEETQASLVGLSTQYILNNFLIKPKVYWKRNQDVFLLKRNDPTFSKNHNISNKIGAELNTSYKSAYGTTGIGVDVAKVSLASNNLGNQDRMMLNAFFEHRFSLENDKLNFTPGVALSYFSDFGSNYFPGLDVGFIANEHLRFYWNIGSSYRVPTYTEMYINIPNFLQGNANLKPEKAFTQDLGFSYDAHTFRISASVFYRNSNQLIDYVKQTSASPFYKAENLRNINTKGFELHTKIPFTIKHYKQQLHLGYTFLEDDYGAISVFKSRYLLNNTIKHHFTANVNTQFFKYVSQSISYRYIERPINKYHVLDAKLKISFKAFELYGLVNNILNEIYYEKQFIPMPKSNFEFGLKYGF